MKSFTKYSGVCGRKSSHLCGRLGKWVQRRSDNYGKDLKDRKDLNRWKRNRSLFLPFPQERHSCLLISQPRLCRYCWSLWWSCVLHSIWHGALSPADPGSHKSTWGIQVVTGLFLWFSQKLPQILQKLRLPGAAEWTSSLFQFSPPGYILAKIPTQLKFSVGCLP